MHRESEDVLRLTFDSEVHVHASTPAFDTSITWKLHLPSL